MLKIRLQRIGRIHEPAYRLVVIEHARSPKAGNFVEQVGTYNAKTKERSFKQDRIAYWIGKGAQCSPTVHNMLISADVIKGAKINVLPKKTPPVEVSKNEESAAPSETSVTETAEEAVASAPEDEVPVEA